MASTVWSPAGADLTGALDVQEMLAHDALQGAYLVAGEGRVDRPVLRLNVMTVPDIVRWTKKHEFLLTTGYPLPKTPTDFVDLVHRLQDNGLAGIGIKLDRYMPELPGVVVAAAEDVGLPLVVIPETLAFDDILGQVFATIVNRQAAALAQAHKIHQGLLGIVLAGGGIANLTRELAALLPGASVAVSDQAGQVLAFAGDMAMLEAVGVLEQENLLDVSRLTVGLHDDGSRKWAVGAIRAATMHHGFVVAVEGSQPFGPVAGTAVDQMAVVAALEITRDLAVAAVERQFASNVLHELVTSAEPDAPGAATRGQSFGWDLDRPVAVLVCRHEDESGARRNRRQRHLAAQRAIEAWTSAVRSRDRKAATAGFTTELVAIIGATPDPEAIARAVQAEISALTRRTYSVGVSQPAEDHTAIPLAYQQARSALTLGRRVSGPGSVTGFGGLGLFRLLTQVSETDLTVFVEDTLGPVLALDPDQRDDLLRTLEVLLEQHLNVAESSRILHYHYNTLRYRITKLEKLLGPFSSEPPIALRLAVALQILRMHEMSATRR